MDKQRDMGSRGALEGIVVLDLTRVVAGPAATMYLADLGADVIKLENPDGGDDLRFNPPFIGDFSIYFASYNRNKRSVTLNLKHPEGKKLFLALVREADVVIENYRPGVMDRLGLGYDVLHEVNPELIYAQISGFGSSGPYAQRPGYDIIAQAMGGIMKLNGLKGTVPTQVGVSVGDISAGMNAVIGILAALIARERTGQGQKVDVALTDSIAALCAANHAMYFAGGVPCGQIGNHSPVMAPFGVYRAADSAFVIACGNIKLAHRCLTAIGREDMIEWPEFRDMGSACEHLELLIEAIEGWSMQRTAKECLDTLMAEKIPCAPIYGIEEMVQDEHIAGAREMYIQMETPGVGAYTVTGNPIKLSDTPVFYRSAPRRLGVDGSEVWASFLGLSAKEQSALREKGVI